MLQMWRARQRAGKAERNGTSFLRSETAASGANRPTLEGMIRPFDSLFSFLRPLSAGKFGGVFSSLIKKNMQQPNRRLILFSGALAFILSNAYSIALDTEHGWQWKMLSFAGVALAIALHFYGLFVVAAWMQRRYPGLPLTRRRLERTFLYGIPTIALLIAGTDTLQQFLEGRPVVNPFTPMALFGFFIQGLAIGIFIIALSEAVYQYRQLQQMEREKQELQRLNWMAQYDSLKQQVNPHFLFNSLNSLSSLIAIDPQKAEKFVEEMSEVYRYLLQSSRDELTLVGAEIGFLRSYLHLLKTRFGDALQVVVEVPQEFHRYRIPPLTLQLLIENAVKHNAVSSGHPLQLHISVVEGLRLRVSNNLQPKTQTIPSEKVGLANIMAKYRLLGQPEVIVRADDKHFIVLLPLIQPVAL
jgi:uncharacterized membrane-anchored protein YhcB (DUF1043 family)